MNTLFFSIEDLNKLTTLLYNNENVKVGFCEELEVDVIEWYNNAFTIVEDVTFFEELIILMNQHFNISIQKYDVTELIGYGVGFVFLY